MKKLLFIIASEGFQPMEYFEPKKILENAGVEVITGSDKKGKVIASRTQEIAQSDISLEEIKPSDYDGIFLVGGHGAVEYLDNEKTYKIFREIAKSNKLWGAICISPRILAAAGVLAGKKATGWDGDGELSKILKKAGAEYVDEPVVVDNNLITATGPSAALAWGEAILQKL